MNKKGGIVAIGAIAMLLFVIWFFYDAMTLSGSEQVAIEEAFAPCSCSSNHYNCDDFKTPEDAQECFEYCGGTSNDVHHLDGDDDGKACEPYRE